MQFIDLAIQQDRIRTQIESNVRQVLQHGRYILGPEVRKLESELSEFTGAPHALGCGSGTDALLLLLMALGVGPGDAVFCPTFTFIATAEVVALLGATPIFVDIQPESFNLDPSKLDQAIKALDSNDPQLHPLPQHRANSLTPRAVIGVDLFGLPADYKAITRIADPMGIAVIEDANLLFPGHSKSTLQCLYKWIGPSPSPRIMKKLFLFSSNGFRSLVRALEDANKKLLVPVK